MAEPLPDSITELVGSRGDPQVILDAFNASYKDADVANSHKVQLLVQAVQKEHEDLVILLLKKWYKKSNKTKLFIGLINMTIPKGNVKIIKLLFEHIQDGCNIEQWRKDGIVLIDQQFRLLINVRNQVLFYDNVKILQILLSLFDDNALIFACSYKAWSCLEYLVKRRRVNINFRTIKGTPLMVGLDNGMGIQHVKLLLQHGALVKIESWNRRTCLHYLCLSSRLPNMAHFHQEWPEILTLLLEMGADPNVVDDNGESALSLCCRHKLGLEPSYCVAVIKCVNILLSSGAQFTKKECEVLNLIYTLRDCNEWTDNLLELLSDQRAALSLVQEILEILLLNGLTIKMPQTVSVSGFLDLFPAYHNSVTEKAETPGECDRHLKEVNGTLFHIAELLIGHRWQVEFPHFLVTALSQDVHMYSPIFNLFVSVMRHAVFIETMDIVRKTIAWMSEDDPIFEPMCNVLEQYTSAPRTLMALSHAAVHGYLCCNNDPARVVKYLEIPEHLKRSLCSVYYH